MSKPATNRARRRKLLWSAIGVTLLVLVMASQTAFNLKFLRPDSLAQTFVFAALSGLIFLALVALIFVLLRTIVKLYLERQTGVLGSRFRSKMVLGALVLSFGPVIAMFLFAYGLMNRSIDKWFSQPIEQVRQRTEAVTSLLSSYAGNNAVAEAQAIAESPDTLRAYHAGRFGPVIEEFRRRERTLQGGFALAFYQDQLSASFAVPEPWGTLREQILPLLGKTASQRPAQFTLHGREYILASAPVERVGLIVIAMPLPVAYMEQLHQLEASQQRYRDLHNNNKLIRKTYMQALLLITLLVLFGSTWSALALSKMVTRPVSALAAGTQALREGRLNYRVEVPAGDELAALVASFNRMSAELELNRGQLQEANQRLEERSLQIETILESIPSGVLSLDAAGQVTRVNAALIRMFRPTSIEHTGTQMNLRLRDPFPPDVAPDLTRDLQRMMRKADRMGTTTTQMEINTGTGPREMGVTVAAMQHPGLRNQRLGYVVVFEDLSELLKAQKQAAWREVARRVAHEIKNPLTPIALSAERIERHIHRPDPLSEQSRIIIESCTETIRSAVETVRTLVDEFATLARFPQSQPEEADLNDIVRDALGMFDGRLDEAEVHLDLAEDLPRVMADPEAMKRVIANLVDNAAESMQNSMVREITISTCLLDTRDAVELSVSDTGHGLTDEVKEKLFLPYFSTKGRGTGLGLAIVARIVEEHRGTIRAEENKPVGARFIVELPVAVSGERATQSTGAEQA